VTYEETRLGGNLASLHLNSGSSVAKASLLNHSDTSPTPLTTTTKKQNLLKKIRKFKFGK
jgi:hypothetical protein